MALSFNFLQTRLRAQRKLVAILMAGYSLITPAGIILGSFISTQSSTLNIIFLSMASGTFLYMSAVEVISEEFVNSDDRFVKYLFYLGGFGFVLLFTYFFDEG